MTTCQSPILYLNLLLQETLKKKTWDTYCKTYIRYDWSATRTRVQSDEIYDEWCDDESVNASR